MFYRFHFFGVIVKNKAMKTDFFFMALFKLKLILSSITEL